MDQNLEAAAASNQQLIKSHFLKNMTKLLLSVSVFSLFFSHYSSWLSAFNWSTFLSRLFTHTIDKNCIFLLCNGLVVFLAKTSGLISSSSKHNQQYAKTHDLHGPKSESILLLETEPPLPLPLVEKKDVISDETIINGSDQENGVVVQGMTSECVMIQEAVERETEKLVLQEEKEIEEEEEEKETEMSRFLIEEEEEEEEEEEDQEGSGSLSTEELNKKFDDFIRRMKEELRIEAQQHLIMV